MWHNTKTCKFSWGLIVIFVRAILRRFKRADGGATAIEFALVAPLLVIILMGILEVSLMFFAAVNLDGAAIDAARRIRTGQSQSTGLPESDFSTALCAKLNAIISCGSVYYDARTVSNYSSVTVGVEVDPDTGEPITYGFSVGGSGDIVVVRTMYYWTFYTPLIGSFFETVPGTSKRLLTSTVVFQSEPYE